LIITRREWNEIEIGNRQLKMLSETIIGDWQKTLQLSVIVRVVGGGPFLRRCLEQLVPQIQVLQAEVIVPFDTSVPEVEILHSEFPEVIFVDSGETIRVVEKGVFHLNAGFKHYIYDVRTAAGLRKAKGAILALLEDYEVPDPDWCAQVLKAHQLPHAAIGGAVEHIGHGLLNWAVYFLDFGRYQLPIREGQARYLTDVNISYKREALESIQSLWENEYNEVIVNWALTKQNHLLWLNPEIIVYQDRGSLNFWNLISERYFWGMIFAKKRSSQIGILKRILYFFLCPFLPFLFITRLTRTIFVKERNRLKFIISIPFIFLLAIGWSFGEMIGLAQVKSK
jgi:hypothetical protein